MSRLLEDMNDFVKERLNKPLDYTGGFKMNETLIEPIMKQKDKDIDDFRTALGLTPLWDEMVKDLTQNPVERKRQLIRLEKEMLVDMVFNLESRNETLVNNLLEVERMYNDLKGEKENG